MSKLIQATPSVIESRRGGCAPQDRGRAVEAKLLVRGLRLMFIGIKS
jgi:hypothetical protein